jgi:hypothetical protein
MQKNNHIKALFFLGIFSLLLLHQVVPHWHHQNEVEHSHKAVAHSESHSHHNDTDKKDSTKNEFLDLFLDIHVHSIASNEVLLTQENSINQIKVKRAVNIRTFIDSYNIPLNYDDKAEKISLYHPPNNYFNKYRSSHHLRGPPPLG